MGIDPSNARPLELVILDKGQELAIRGRLGHRQVAEKIEDLVPVPQSAEGELADHGWVGENGRLVEQSDQTRCSSAQMFEGGS